MMAAALELLDEGPFPADIGAHLDLALHRLREHLLVARGASVTPPSINPGDFAF